jgi:hypothetical protein
MISTASECRISPRKALPTRAKRVAPSVASHLTAPPAPAPPAAFCAPAALCGPAAPPSSSTLKASSAEADAPPHQCVGALQRVAHHGCRTLGAVGQARRVAKITEILGREDCAQSAQHRQTADAGIEHADRTDRYAARQDSGRRCGNSSTSRIDAEFVYSITRRSTPSPRPAVGGMPYSSART